MAHLPLLGRLLFGRLAIKRSSTVLARDVHPAQRNDGIGGDLRRRMELVEEARMTLFPEMRAVHEQVQVRRRDHPGPHILVAVNGSAPTNVVSDANWTQYPSGRSLRPGCSRRSRSQGLQLRVAHGHENAVDTGRRRARQIAEQNERRPPARLVEVGLVRLRSVVGKRNVEDAPVADQSGRDDVVDVDGRQRGQQ